MIVRKPGGRGADRSSGRHAAGTRFLSRNAGEQPARPQLRRRVDRLAISYQKRGGCLVPIVYSKFEFVVQTRLRSTRSTGAVLTIRSTFVRRGTWDATLQLDLIGRYVDRLTAIDVPRYIEMDCRIGWQVRKNLEFSLVGQNLLNNHHLEFVDFVGRRAGFDTSASRRLRNDFLDVLKRVTNLGQPTQRKQAV